MAELSVILDQHGRQSFQSGAERARRRRMRAIRARYDTAQTTEENRRHWAAADGLSADAANRREVREVLRRRSRYECLESNSYAAGMVETLANDTVGTGPTLRVEPNSEDPKVMADARRVEKLFADWAKAIRLQSKLKVMRKAMVVDGEAFGIMRTNPGLRTQVKLDLGLVEADQVTSPDFTGQEENKIDGIQFDQWGNPQSYDILKQHPGDLLALDLTAEKTPAGFVIHLFRQDRPGQHRGIPELTTSLHLFAQLRRFTLATLCAAETAADLAAVLESDGPADEDEDEIDPMDAIEFERNMLLTLPKNYKMNQVKAEHPNTVYSDFKREVLNEAARPVGMPYGIAAANSAGYNFSSAKMDHGLYFHAIEVVRHQFAVECLDRLFAAWLDEAALEGLLPSAESFALFSYWWAWPAREQIDPGKERAAQAVALKNGMTTRAAEYARQGLDVDEQDARAARDYGVDLKTYRQALFTVQIGGKLPTPAGGPDATEGGQAAGSSASPATEGGAAAGGDNGKGLADAYASAVRAGLVTPQPDDELFFRKGAGLPAMGADVAAAWKEEKTRRPITLVKPGDPQADAENAEKAKQAARGPSAEDDGDQPDE